MRLINHRVALPVGQIAPVLVGKLRHELRAVFVSVKASSVKPASAAAVSSDGMLEYRFPSVERFCFWRSGSGHMSIGSSAEYLEISALSRSRRLRTSDSSSPRTISHNVSAPRFMFLSMAVA